MEQRLTTKAWGKLQRDPIGVVLARLGLLEHSIDVAAVAGALLGLPTIRVRLERLAGRALTELDVSRLLVLVFLHDTGKTSTGFQSKCLSDTERARFLARAKIHAAECGHTHVLGRLLHDAKLLSRLAAVFPVAEIEAWDGLDLWLASISHHGSPITLSDLEHHRAARARTPWQPTEDYDPWLNLQQLGDLARTLFPEAFANGGGGLPQAPAFVHAFAGLVSLADWLASNDQPGFFPYGLADGGERWPAACHRARDVLIKMRIDVRPLRDDLLMRRPKFGEVFFDSVTGPYQPTRLQEEMANPGLGPLVIVEAETGSGKTEAALWRFKTLFERGEVDSLVFVLPTRVSAVQIERRVGVFIKALFPDRSIRPNVVLAVPGYLRADGEEPHERLAGFRVLWPDTSDEDAAHRRWAAESTKRYLAACCAIGTVDQVLLAGLQVRHAHLRGFSLLRSLLVVDEVHSSDIYMARILRNVLKRHEDAGGHGLLLSATLGRHSRDEFLRGAKATRQDAQGEFEREDPYPSIADFAGVRVTETGGRSKTVQTQIEPWIDDFDQVAKAAGEAIEAGARVLIVRNTVDAVLATQQAIEAHIGLDHPALFRAGEGAIACPHHGRYAAPDRRILDAAVEGRYGKRGPSSPQVLCGTQTLEQSLDIDADLLITDLAPIDVLLQRIGRLHRHADRTRPVRFQSARVIVLVPLERDLLTYLANSRAGHGFRVDRAYENVLAVDATWDLLERFDELRIPEHNRQIVEAVVDKQRLLDRAERNGGGWMQRWQALVGGQGAKLQQASLNLCRWSDPWEESVFPDIEERIRTRLGADGIRVPLPEPWRSPFGTDLVELVIPAWMWPAGFEPDEARAESEGETLAINLKERRLRYDRLGLHRHGN